MKKRMLIMIVGVLVLVAVLGGGFYLHIQKLIASAPKPIPQTVSTIEAQNQQWQPQLKAIGSLTAVQGVEVSTEASGLVNEVMIDSGAFVKAGTVLLTLSSAVDQAQLESLQAAADLSASVLKRDQQQLKARAISQAVIDADTADLKGKVAAVAQQQALLDQKTIRAPFAGQLGVTSISPGQYLSPGSSIVSLQSLDPINIDFIVPQSEITRVAIDMVANLTADAFGDKVFTGKITAVDSQVDSQTRNVTVRANVPNPDGQLLPGMFVRVSVDIGKPEQDLTLPQAAITYNAYGSTVFIVEPAGSTPASAEAADSSAAPAADKSATTQKSGDSESSANGSAEAKGQVVRQVFVTTGNTRGDQVAVLDGLKVGQIVVTSGQMKLKNGTAVTIDNSVQPANDPNPTPQEQ